MALVFLREALERSDDGAIAKVELRTFAHTVTGRWVAQLLGDVEGAKTEVDAGVLLTKAVAKVLPEVK